MSLDLESGYLQVRMKEECKAYMASTVGLLRFYNVTACLGLINASATFQYLMETCLGDLQLNWWHHLP